MVKLKFEGTDFFINAEVDEFYCNDYPNFFARTDKGIYLRSMTETFFDVPEMITGNRPADGGHLIIEAKDFDDFVAREPKAKKYIKRLIGSKEFIQNLKRYCLWLVDCPPQEIRKMPLVYKRVKLCREARLKGAPDRQKLAATPWLFRETNNPAQCLVVPKVSSERRDYIPIDFVGDDVILTDLLFMIPDAKFWHFGVLTSRQHMTWMRTICGRLESRYRYSADVVYNNFPWPPFNREVERTAVEILSARRKYPDASFADLYDPLIMPKELRRAHEKNDRAVAEAYDFPPNITEEQMQIAFLNMYRNLTNTDKIIR